MRYFTLILLLLCAACSQLPPESICPAVIPYSSEQQNGLLAELYQHPDLKYVPLFLEGCSQTRDALRSLSKKQDDIKA